MKPLPHAVIAPSAACLLTPIKEPTPDQDPTSRPVFVGRIQIGDVSLSHDEHHFRRTIKISCPCCGPVSRPPCCGVVSRPCHPARPEVSLPSCPCCGVVSRPCH